MAPLDQDARSPRARSHTNIAATPRPVIPWQRSNEASS
ncbi:Hypothetical protein CAP_0035 [Chondromyces apiculatus DSM 436]|uniref:Uncharacterized protein n=1 Tax=Chondromyces apiculatus DSM 436 TaxID=1192034 RepID=A0A017TJX1_9BACT|nr:Hypothetical protein CAP_0035 [Chondromyces apiculatus DSM 436]